MSIHSNSIRAYYEEVDKLTGRRAAVYKIIKQHGPVTDRQAMNLLGYTDMNAVRPRITELITKGILRECGNIRCPITRKVVRQVDVLLKSDPEQFGLNFNERKNHAGTHTTN